MTTEPTSKSIVELLIGMSDDTLATMADDWKRESKRLAEMSNAASYELLRRVRDRGATKLDTPSWSGTLKPSGYQHTIADPDGLRFALKAAGVGDAILDAAYNAPPPPPRRWDQRALNEMRKYGGVIAETIDRFRRSTPNDPTLELTRKPGTDAELAGAIQDDADRIGADATNKDHATLSGAPFGFSESDG